MGDAPNLVNSRPPSLPSPPPPPPQKSNLPMLYYGLVVVGTAALLLAIYNFIVIKWCAYRHEDPSRRRRNQLAELTAVHTQSTSRSLNQEVLASFKYKKGSIGAQDKESDYECPVCLSAFEEGEEVRVLPRCNHSFHAPCIDMWLYSHSDCPLCRAHVGPPTICSRYLVIGTPSENSREGLLGLPS